MKTFGIDLSLELHESYLQFKEIDKAKPAAIEAVNTDVVGATKEYKQYKKSRSKKQAVWNLPL